ncbi:hypothetical protein [Streptomyces sp. NPDC101455]|uniref:hypothetical protein n=1 Tax=Streptomyces sp. NPDC101455 TaxID=3366142 RepID=UPI003817B4F3
MDVVDPYEELKKQTAEAEARFASEAEGARMTVLRDEGMYRHLHFDFPRASWKWCEVLTWPGSLILNGGLGSWLFLATGEDLIEMLRPSASSQRVDPLYWEGKLAPGSGTARTYSPDRATAYIRETACGLASDFPGLAQDVDTDILDGRPATDLSTEGGLRAALAAFEELHGCTYEGLHFPVQSWDLERFDVWFLLSCVVLPWAVEQYDAQLTPVG